MNNESERGDHTTAHASPGAPSWRRALTFLAVLIVCIAGAVTYATREVSRSQAAAAAQPRIAVTSVAELPVTPTTSVAPTPPPNPEAAASIAARPVTSQVVATSPAASSGNTKVVSTIGSAADRPYLLFRSTALGDTYGRVSVEYLDALGGQRLVTQLQCERVHFAAGFGVCLEARRGALTTYHAHIFDRRLDIKQSYDLAGPPSRARMSPDGRLAAVTVFVSGHSYASVGFTTRTSVIDVAAGKWLVDDLEKFYVMRDGAVIKASDFNFWGVTFTRNSRRFYATLGTAGKTILIEGDLSARTLRVMHDDVECPSLSPDNTKIAFKRRRASETPGRFVWGLHVLDIATGKETALVAERRNVDDQVEWLGARDVLYAMPEDTSNASAATNIWALPVDGVGPPRLLVPLAFSPTAVR